MIRTGGWCERGDSNPHGPSSPPDPKSGASANSATFAEFASVIVVKTEMGLKCVKLGRAGESRAAASGDGSTSAGISLSQEAA